MRSFPMLLVKVIVLLTGLATPVPCQENRFSPVRFPNLLDQEGFAGAFAGVSHGTLLMAGGAHFPDKRPWEGGQKVWTDQVFALARPEGPWKTVGQLPRPLGYGVSVSQGQRVFCVGGSDARQHYRESFFLEWRNQSLNVTSGPALPKPVANASAALIGDTLYLAGGTAAPDSSTTLATVWAINLAESKPSWYAVKPIPSGGRMLAVAAQHDDAFWLIGGVDLIASKDGTLKRKYLSDVWSYRPKAGWKQARDLPYPIAAAPSPAPTGDEGFLIIGGDDGSQVNRPPTNHPGFRQSILKYAPATNTWTKVGEWPKPRVTVPIVPWNKHYLLLSGESRPGIRSPEVWGFTMP